MERKVAKGDSNKTNVPVSMRVQIDTIPFLNFAQNPIKILDVQFHKN